MRGHRKDGATAFEFFLSAVVLHEFVHFGNNLSQVFYPNFGRWDAGFQFENKYYGGEVKYEPRTTNSPTVIWFNKIPGL